MSNVIKKNFEIIGMIQNHPRFEDNEKLMEFEGWGACKELVNPSSDMAKEFRQECVKNLTGSELIIDEMLSDAQSATLTSFFTPRHFATAIRKAAEDIFEKLNGYYPSTMLEPSAGSGRFLMDEPVAQVIDCVEKDFSTAVVLSKTASHIKCSKVDLTQSSFGNFPWDKRYDLIVSNIPFGDVYMADEEGAKRGDIFREAQKRIHNMYFMKSVELLNDRGILAFITSRGFLSSPDNRKFRDYISQQCQCISIVRLPDNLFPTVDVGTDLIVLQKIGFGDRSDNPKLINLTNVFEYGLPENQNWYLAIPGTEMKIVKNKFGKEVVRCTLKDAASKGPELYELLTGVPYTFVPEVQTVIPSGSFYFFFEIEESELPKPKVQKPKVAKMETPTDAGEFVKEAVGFMQRNYEQLMTDTSNEEYRTSMRNCYNNMLAYTNEKYGENLASFHEMVAAHGEKLSPSERQLLDTLEQKDKDGKWVPADIFFKDVMTKEERTDLTAEEALASSLNMLARVDMGYMTKHSGLDAAELAEKLKGSIFFNPITGCYEEKDLWLSGNVVAKAQQAEKFLEKYKDGKLIEAQYALAELRAVRPMVVPFDDIDVALGARWVPVDVYKKFVCWALSGSEEDANLIDLFYVPTTDQFVGNFGACDNNKWHEWKVKNTSSEDMVLSAMQGALPNFTKQDPNDSEKSIPDEEAIARAAKIVEEIRRTWSEWVNLPRNAELRKELEQIYNDRFNNEVRPRYDGSFQTFPGLCLNNLGIESLYDSQKDAIWMIKRNGGGVCWHEVGSGKTLIMCIAAYEMKRIGMCKKPVITGLKANIAQIAETFQKAYPNAKVLFPKKEEWGKQQRIDLFNQIRNNDWDCIIMTHDQFGYIPAAYETEIRLMKEEIDSLDDVLEDIESKGKRKWGIMKGLQKRRERLRAKLLTRHNEIRADKDNVMDFRTMGIDHIFVDESHYFKNLPFATRNERVGGIGNPTGSKRAWKLLTALRDIQDRTGRDLGGTFLSGTIVSNSLTELYIIFKYLRPKALAEQGIHSFDAWSAIFCELKRDFEVDVVGRIRAKERFAAYVNLPELGQFLRQITDYRTAAMVGLDVPNAVQHFESAQPTEQQRVMLERLTKFVDSKNWGELGIQRERPGKDKQAFEMSLMLTATNLARQVALDPRLLDDCKTFGDEMGNKVRRCAENIYRIYLETNEHKGTQFVFSDTSTYDTSKWNMQSAVHDILVEEYGVPSSEIAFINKANTDKQRLALFEAMNAGKVRVLIGSTQKLGTGVNAQQRAVAIHHLDIPWRPSDLEQRNGRAIRKGNEVKLWGGNKVDIYLYATERTLDAYKFNLLKNKQAFIDQLNSGQLGLRRIDESTMKDGDSAVGYAEFLALLTGNDDLLHKAKLDAKIMAMEKDHAMWQRQRNAMIEKVKEYETFNSNDAEWIRKAKIDLHVSENLTADTPIIIGGKSHTGKGAGEAVIHVGEVYTKNTESEFGKCDTFRLTVVRDDKTYEGQIPLCSFFLIGESGQYYKACQGSFKNGHITKGQGVENASHFVFDTRTAIIADVERFKKEIENRTKQLPSMKAFCEKVWDGEDDLKMLREERDAVMASIAKLEKKAA